MAQNEIKDDIKNIKKNLKLRFKYYLHLFLYYGIVGVSLLLLVYYLDYYIHLKIGYTITISVIYLFFMIFLNIIYIRGGFKNICQEEGTATQVHSTSKLNVLTNDDNIIYNHWYTDIWLIKYQYKKKTYTRIVEMFDNDDIQMRRKKINIKICKYFPKLIYIEKVNKDKKTNEDSINIEKKEFTKFLKVIGMIILVFAIVGIIALAPAIKTTIQHKQDKQIFKERVENIQRVIDNNKK